MEMSNSFVKLPMVVFMALVVLARKPRVISVSGTPTRMAMPLSYAEIA